MSSETPTKTGVMPGYGKEMFILTPELMLRAAEALEYKAQMEAGMAVSPFELNKEEYDEWKDAQVIRAAVDQGLLP